MSIFIRDLPSGQNQQLKSADAWYSGMLENEIEKVGSF
jgi:hypothetical protein